MRVCDLFENADFDPFEEHTPSAAEKKDAERRQKKALEWYEKHYAKQVTKFVSYLTPIPPSRKLKPDTQEITINQQRYMIATQDPVIIAKIRRIGDRSNQAQVHRAESGTDLKSTTKMIRKGGGRWPGGDKVMLNYITNLTPQPFNFICPTGNIAAFREYVTQRAAKAWPAIEPLLLEKLPSVAFDYCRVVLNNKRWPELERVILSALTSGTRNPDQAAFTATVYAKNVLKGRWLEAEPGIAKYGAITVITDYIGASSHTRMQAAESQMLQQAISATPEYKKQSDFNRLITYCATHMRGNWPQLTTAIEQHGTAVNAAEYATRINAGAWPPAKKIIELAVLSTTYSWNDAFIALRDYTRSFPTTVWSPTTISRLIQYASPHFILPIMLARGIRNPDAEKRVEAEIAGGIYKSDTLMDFIKLYAKKFLGGHWPKAGIP